MKVTTSHLFLARASHNHTAALLHLKELCLSLPTAINTIFILVSTHFASDFNLVLVNLSQGDGFSKSGYFNAI